MKKVNSDPAYPDPDSSGLTRLEHFAGLAMVGAMSNFNEHEMHKVCEIAYRQAKMMLAYLDQEGKS